MATRSTIALEYADGTVAQVYCHWDGYLENNGRILQQHYTDPVKLSQLIDLGDLSSLGSHVGTQHDFDSTGDECTFYGRDRGETGTEAHRFANFDDYVENHQTEEFEYILRQDGQWYVDQGCGFRLLNDELAVLVD